MTYISRGLKEFSHKIDKGYNAKNYEGPYDAKYFFLPQNTLGEIHPHELRYQYLKIIRPLLDSNKGVWFVFIGFPFLAVHLQEKNGWHRI